MTHNETLDVLIIGAGLSGIDAAYRLQTSCPTKTYSVIEARDRIGGTWDLFRYPGIRSDSDVETLGFPFRPWDKDKSIADGESIREYIEDTAREFGIDQKIRFGRKATRARWSSAEAVWTVDCVDSRGDTSSIRCRFLYACTGYYDYAEGYQPSWPGMEDFQGDLIHPQFWPSGFDAKGKSIVIIGSGATAITLLPALAEKAESVTMLQRSPTYVVSLPSADPLSRKIRAWIPAPFSSRLVRLKNIGYGIFVYQYARRWPEKARATIMHLAQRQVPSSVDVQRDFNPRYNPWEQRLCLAPDGDFFRALRSGKGKVETAEIDRFVKGGIKLRSGKTLQADAIVSATGLRLQLLGGMAIEVDEQAIELSDLFSYKGILMSGVPNFAMAIGYTNASWTLKCDLSARYVCRLLNHMDSHGHKTVMPYLRAEGMETVPLLNLTSGYIKRREHALPKQGARRPWRLYQNYFMDWVALGFGRIDEASLRFSAGAAQPVDRWRRLIKTYVKAATERNSVRSQTKMTDV